MNQLAFVTQNLPSFVPRSPPVLNRCTTARWSSAPRSPATTSSTVKMPLSTCPSHTGPPGSPPQDAQVSLTPDVELIVELVPCISSKPLIHMNERCARNARNQFNDQL